MQICRTVREVRAVIAEKRRDNPGGGVGFAPTMGALHDGHASLIRASVAENAVTLVSLFVNPAQFLPCEDFDAYPRTFEEDAHLVERIGAEILFAPAACEIYPLGFATKITPEGPAANALEGECRPGFFSGVATIVTKLLNIVEPDRAYFGEKDFQQLCVIKQIVTDLNLPVSVRSTPTKREENGLALSSRNAYLSPAEKEIAPKLYHILCETRDMILNDASVETALESVEEKLLQAGFASVDYVSLRDATSFKETPCVLPGFPARLLTAARLGKTRLIDNLSVERPA